MSCLSCRWIVRPDHRPLLESATRQTGIHRVYHLRPGIFLDWHPPIVTFGGSSGKDSRRHDQKAATPGRTSVGLHHPKPVAASLQDHSRHLNERTGRRSSCSRLPFSPSSFFLLLLLFFFSSWFFSPVFFHDGPVNVLCFYGTMSVILMIFV